MANKLISQLGATAGVVATDVFEIEKLAGPPSQKATITQLTTLLSTIYAPITGGAYVLKAGDIMTGALAIDRSGIVAVSTDGATLQNLTAATAGVPVQISPRIRLRSNAWNTTTPATNTDDWFIESVPVSGATPSGLLRFGKSLNGGAVTYPFTLSSSGALVTSGGGSITSGSGIFSSSFFAAVSLGVLRFPSNGVLTLSNIAETDFSRLQFGGTTSAFPAIKRSATILQARLADDSAYAPTEANTVRTATAYTVATLPVAGSAGRRAYVTDATAPAFNVALVGGGGVVTPCFDNGAAWLAG